jgi:hypothetical protein
MGTSKKFAPYGITIDGDDQYELGVELTLHRIETSYTGQVLLSAIKSTSKSIQIIPWTDSNVCNAESVPFDSIAATPANQYILKQDSDHQSTFQPMLRPSAIRSLLNLPLEPYKGTGTGSDATVRFTPSMWGYGVKGACAKYAAGAPGASPSLVLFHELSHSYRAAKGGLYPRPMVGSSLFYNDTEEFFAVVLTNVLATDPTFSTANRSLRADHTGHSTLAADLSTSKGFVANASNRNMMKELAKSEPDLYIALSGSQSTFNPFAVSLEPETIDIKTVVVAKGDSLSSLSAKYYGTEEYWPLLYRKNFKVVGPNPNRITPGMQLQVFPLSAFTPAFLDEMKRQAPFWKGF